MGRNANSSKNTGWDVPIGGTVLRNSNGQYFISTADGKQFTLTTLNAAMVLSRANGYGKFIDVWSATTAYATGGVPAANTVSAYSIGCGNVVAANSVSSSPISTSAFFVAGNIPRYMGTGPGRYVNTPSSTIGNVTAVMSRFLSTNVSYSGQPQCALYNTSTKTYLGNVGSSCVHVWFDSTTNTTRVLAGASTSLTLYTSTDNLTWTAVGVSGGPTINQIGSASFPEPSVIAHNNFVGIVAFGGTGYQVYVSTNGGAAFNEVTSNMGGSTITWSAIQGSFQSYNPSNSTWFIWRTPTSSIYSNNNGNSWVAPSGVGNLAVPQNMLCATYGASNAEMMVVSNPGNSSKVMYTSDGGVVWTTTNWAQPSGAPVNLLPLCVEKLGSNWYILFSSGVAGAGTWVGRSTNNGSTWSYQQIDTVSDSTSLFFAFDSSLYLAVTNSQKIYRSTNGTTWTQIYSGPFGVPTGYTYGYNLTNYVNVFNIVINKSTNACLPVSDKPYLFFDQFGASAVRSRLTSDIVTICSGNSGAGSVAVIFHDSASSAQHTYATPQSNNTQIGNGSDFSYAQAYEYLRVR